MPVSCNTLLFDISFLISYPNSGSIGSLIRYLNLVLRSVRPVTDTPTVLWFYWLSSYMLLTKGIHVSVNSDYWWCAIYKTTISLLPQMEKGSSPYT